MIQQTPSQRLGLALSGGGFRAVLYHLGVVRFLRDAGLLPSVAQITSVSGGSVLGAHLVLNWSRYCGSDAEFEDVSAELLRFLQLDVRNRIVRRFPLASAVNGARRILRMEPKWQYTRAGLLEQHYEKFLYGDTALFGLPDRPQLYILATNLSEGSLCAFHRGGMMLQRRASGANKHFFEDVEIGLATVSMAVAASSAFPGFFPPLEIRSSDVGAREGEFGRLAFTDGGIYDNLGLRMFRHLERWGHHRRQLETVNIIDAEALNAMLCSGAQMPEGTVMRELVRRMMNNGEGVSDLAAGLATLKSPDVLTERILSMSRRDELYRIPKFQSLPLSNPRTQTKLREIIASRESPEIGDRVWLNCELAAAAFHQAAGKPCLAPVYGALDGILVSDAGASFKVQSDGRAGGLFSTAIRSTDILMDRVNQLEVESFGNTAGTLFFPIRRMVTRSEDPTAPHLEIQRQAALIRTDMDRFSGIEIESLVQHGYCVARQVYRQSCRTVGDCPDTPPWNPMTRDSSSPGPDPVETSLSGGSKVLQLARTLQRSSSRKTVSTLFSYRDWPTYFWVPLLALVLLALPYVLYSVHQTAVHQDQVLSVVAQTSPVYGEVLNLLEMGPELGIEPLEYTEVPSIEPLDFHGYDVISDDRIYDLRGWRTTDPSADSAPRMHAHFRIRRTADAEGRPRMRIQLPSDQAQLSARYRPISLRPVHTRTQKDSGLYFFETTLDFSRVPIGSDTDVVVDQILPMNVARQDAGHGCFKFSIAAKTGLVRIWVLLPRGRDHDQFKLLGCPIQQEDRVKMFDATSTIELRTGAIVTFEMINPENNYRYECTWNWRDVGAGI